MDYDLNGHVFKKKIGCCQYVCEDRNIPSILLKRELIAFGAVPVEDKCEEEPKLRWVGDSWVSNANIIYDELNKLNNGFEALLRATGNNTSAINKLQRGE